MYDPGRRWLKGPTSTSSSSTTPSRTDENTRQRAPSRLSASHVSGPRTQPGPTRVEPRRYVSGQRAVSSDLHVRVDVHGGGVEHGHASQEVPASEALPYYRLAKGKLQAVVDPHGLLRQGGGHGLQTVVVAGGAGDELRQVVLAARAASEAAKAGPEPRAAEAVDAYVHLRRTAHRALTVRLFDDVYRVALAVSPETAQAAGVLHVGCQESEVGAGLVVVGHQGGHRLGQDERMSPLRPERGRGVARPSAWRRAWPVPKRRRCGRRTRSRRPGPPHSARPAHHDHGALKPAPRRASIRSGPSAARPEYAALGARRAHACPVPAARMTAAQFIRQPFSCTHGGRGRPRQTRSAQAPLNHFWGDHGIEICVAAMITGPRSNRRERPRLMDQGDCMAAVAIRRRVFVCRWQRGWPSARHRPPRP
jgi:hypothetical protein